jgi:hypothetical protein
MSQNHRLLAMTNIRQRKMDPSPSSRGSQTEDMIRIVIDDSPNTHFNFDECENNDVEFDSYHYTPQPPRMITDKQYKNFLEGKPLDPKDQVAFYPSGPECASMCISFSWVGFVFLVRENENPSTHTDRVCYQSCHSSLFFKLSDMGRIYD